MENMEKKMTMMKKITMKKAMKMKMTTKIRPMGRRGKELGLKTKTTTMKTMRTIYPPLKDRSDYLIVENMRYKCEP